jgi:hypothetical protein
VPSRSEKVEKSPLLAQKEREKWGTRSIQILFGRRISFRLEFKPALSRNRMSEGKTS